MMACMFNKGENCIAAGRLFVEASIHDEYIHRVVRIANLSRKLAEKNLLFETTGSIREF